MRKPITEETRHAIMHCPVCNKQTQHRSLPVSNIPRAVLADGTCDHCWRHKLNLQRKRPTGHPVSADDVASWQREALAAFFRERRNRGVDPNGNAELDEAYENDTEWHRAERARIKQERKEARESKDLPEVSGSGRGTVPPLRDDRDARPPASAKQGHGRLPLTPHTI